MLTAVLSKPCHAAGSGGWEDGPSLLIRDGPCAGVGGRPRRAAASPFDYDRLAWERKHGKGNLVYLRFIGAQIYESLFSLATHDVGDAGEIVPKNHPRHAATWILRARRALFARVSSLCRWPLGLIH